MRVSDVMTGDVVRVAVDCTLDEAMETMEESDVRHLPVLDGERLVGVLSERDVLELTGWLPRRLREVLEAPDGTALDFMHHPVVTVSPTDTLVTTSLRMLQWGIGCLPVLDGTKLVGIVTELDLLTAYADACGEEGAEIVSDPNVSELMSVDVMSAQPDTPADDAHRFCHEKGIRHLPVLEDGRLVGIVSDRDLRMCVGRGQLEGTLIGGLVPKRLRTIEPDAKLSAAARLMIRHRIGAVPVVDRDCFVGLLSAADVFGHCTRAFEGVSNGA